MRKEFKLQRTDLVHQHGSLFECLVTNVAVSTYAKPIASQRT